MLAQLVEQRTFNPFVVGSTPAHPTKIPNEIKDLASVQKTRGFLILAGCQNIARISADALKFRGLVQVRQ